METNRLRERNHQHDGLAAGRNVCRRDSLLGAVGQASGVGSKDNNELDEPATRLDNSGKPLCSTKGREDLQGFSWK